MLEPAGVLPQQAERLDASPVCGADEVVVDVSRLNLDAASYRQLRERHGVGGVRRAVLDIVAARGKMQNPVTGSGGMLLGTVREVGPRSPSGLRVGDRIASLVSLTLTPLRITDGLAGWDGRDEQVPCEGTAVLFGRSIAAVLPRDLPEGLALSVLDVCGAPALTDRVVRRRSAASVLVLGGGGKSGSLSLAAARRAGASRLVALVPTDREAAAVRASGLADEVVVADARDPLAVAAAVGERVEVTVVCVDVAGCEHGAVLATADGGVVVFFSMATSFAAAALGAEGLAADVEMLIGNGYVPGHAEFALGLLRGEPAVRALFEDRQTQRA
ncbi:L-erythro-3,5-diaminohexanoate dehydrogenase [Actinosynnema sp. NPDC053489]|uniref:L-erythro-3,5-diaminohexanoate dehydrogenase n=1 Tax=Actinosynnema sp. NPDC053489 TaxID=3363916 RepID=UPI0037CC014C